jgi:uncharacterized repeat protein (TIGR03847 family)
VSRSYDLGAPDLFTAGTVGPPGERIFYLQARERGVLLTLKVEKEQVGALAEYLAGLLAKHPAPEPPPGAPAELALVEPLVPAWAVRSLAVGYDEAHERVVIVAEEAREEEEEEKEEGEEPAEAAGEPASARVAVTRGQARAFVERARSLVKGGRPTCPLCSRPMNPGGHVCPRHNGAHRD